MRAPLLRRAFFRAGILGGVLAVAGFAACADAVHLDPPAAPDGGSTSTGPTTGCHSNPDCAFPKAICDTASGTCVECLEVSDCAYMPGTVCSKGVCGCYPATLTYCAGETPACVDTKTSATDCGGCGKACTTTCAAGKCGGGSGGGGGAGGSSSSSTTAGAGGVGVGAGGADAG